MAVVMRDYHGHSAELSDEDEAVAWFDEQVDAIMPHGGSGQTIWIGADDGPPVLRADVDVEVDRAAMCWLPDGSHAVELDQGVSISVYESADTGLVTVPAALVRITASTARAAIAEYAATGAQPSSVRWAIV